MPQQITVKAAGLWLQANDLDAPDGAMSQADDIVIARDGVVEPRRGKAQCFDFGVGATIKGQWPAADPAYGNTLVWAQVNTASGDRFWEVDVTGASGSYLSLGSLNLFTRLEQMSTGLAWPYGRQPEWTPAAAYGNALFTSTALGIYRLFSLANAQTIARAGVAPGLDASYALSSAGSPQALATGYEVGYKVVWLRKDQNGNWQRGAPSPMLLVQNAAGATRDVTLTITVPQCAGVASTTGWGPSANDQFEVYRSISDPIVAGVSSPNGGALYLCYTGTYTSGTTVTFTDSLTDAQLGAALYTNDTQQGSTQENSIPPVCYDIATYRGSMLYANTAESSADLTVFATGTGNVDVGSTITINGQVYTGAAAENLATNTFLADKVAGTPALQWANTAASLIRVINRGAFAPSALVYAISTDSPTGVPGHIHIATKIPATVTVTTTAANGLRISTTGWLTHPARVYSSKATFPEAVPALNFADVGDPSGAVIRIIATRNAVFIFKEDGLFILTGDAFPWSISPFDPTCKLVSEGSAVMLDNSVFGLTTQGVVRVTDTGVTVLSRAIEPALQSLLPPNWTNYASLAAVGYESNREYTLWTPNGDGYTYNLFTRAWYRRTDSVAAALIAVTPKNTMYLGSGRYIYQELKTLTASDYNDGGSAINCAWTFTPRVGTTPGKKHQFTIANLQYRAEGTDAATVNFWTDLVKTAQPVSIDFSVYGTRPLGSTNVRTWVPLEASRGSELYVQVQQPVLNQTFQFQALGILARETSEEAGS